MTPRYTWTPASEPPDTGRMVIVWRRGDWDAAFYWHKRHVFENDYGPIEGVTHWHDVKPPEGAS